MSLEKLEADFQHYLLNSEIKPILSAVAEDKRFSAEKRLEVYHTGYRLRLLEIHRQDFEKTHTLLGDDEMDKAFFAYLEKHPSKHFSVRYFGQYFAEFLLNTLPYKNFPVLGEMAYFEWLVSFTIDAPDAPVLTVAELGTIPFEAWPELVFEFHPALTSRYFSYDTPQLWQDIDNESEPRIPELQPNPIRWIFYRKGLRSFYLSCTPIEDKIFTAITEKQCFADICETLIDDLPEDQIPLTVAQTLHKWVSEGMITRII